MVDRDRFIAMVQALLTFLLVIAFVVLLVMGKQDAATAIKEFAGMAVMFWLMRHRPNGASQDSEDAKPAPPAPLVPLEFPQPKVAAK